LAGVRREERGLLLLSALYFFLVMASYFILRPIRDQMGVAGGVDNLAWLFSGTLSAMLLLNPMFSALVSRWPRRRFVAWSYRALMVCLLGFYLALQLLPDSSAIWTGRAFFIWVSVFNLFAVSLFWAVMADVFRSEASRRLYGVIAAGGSLGALVGGVITSGLVARVGAPALLLVSLVLLELALWCMFAIHRRASAGVAQASVRDAGDQVIGGRAIDGFRLALRSPYLIGMCGYMLLYTIGSTFLYFLQAQIVDATIEGRAAQTAYFANVDIWVNGLTLVLQLFLTGRLMARVGVGLTLAALPLISVLGFAGLGLVPVLGAVVVFTVARRVTNFAFSRPAREALFVPLSRGEKYKAKNLIDTLVYRIGDSWEPGPTAC
jgi:AAA family ATP:ADP antiporter